MRTPCEVVTGPVPSRSVIPIITFLLLLVGALGDPAQAEQPSKGSTSSRAQADALSKIPFGKLHRDVHPKLKAVLQEPSMFRRLPTQALECDADMYVFLVRHPEVVVNMWQLMGVTALSVRRTGDFTFECNDGAGTIGTVELIYGTRNQHIFYATGVYEGPLLKRKLRGNCVLVLNTVHSEHEGRPRVTSSLDVFVRMENVGIDLVTRTLHPLMGKTADINFRETNRFIGEVSRAAETKYAGIQNLMPKLTNVEPEILQAFSSTAAAVNRRARNRSHGLPSQGVQVSKRPGATKSER